MNTTYIHCSVMFIIESRPTACRSRIAMNKLLDPTVLVLSLIILHSMILLQPDEKEVGKKNSRWLASQVVASHRLRRQRMSIASIIWIVATCNYCHTDFLIAFSFDDLKYGNLKFITKKYFTILHIFYYRRTYIMTSCGGCCCWDYNSL